MTYREAYDFLAPAVDRAGGIWADLGAGEGTFAVPLSAMLGPSGKVYALDRSEKVRHITARAGGAEIIPVLGDFTSYEAEEPLDGMLMANALHFAGRPQLVLEKLHEQLKPSGRIVIIEYDRTMGNPWVPYPVSFQQLKAITTALGWVAPLELNRRTSRYGQGSMYLALIQKA